MNDEDLEKAKAAYDHLTDSQKSMAITALGIRCVMDSDKAPIQDRMEVIRTLLMLYKRRIVADLSDLLFRNKDTPSEAIASALAAITLKCIDDVPQLMRNTRSAIEKLEAAHKQEVERERGKTESDRQDSRGT